MEHQNWENLTIHGKTQKKKQEVITETVRAQRGPTMSCAERSLRTDDPEKPKSVDADKSKKLMKLRTQVLKLTMKQMAQNNNIPFPEYQDLENGKLIKTKADALIQRIFNRHKQQLNQLM